MLKLAPALLVLTLASAGFAQTRGPVVPNFQQPEAQQPAPSAAPAPKADDVDLVGPTEAQQKRAQAAAEAKVRAEAEARARAEAEARLAAEAKLKAEAEARARLEAEAAARARLAAEAKLKAEAETRARLEAQARADAEARARAEAQARAEAEARVIAEARAKFAAEEEARARAKAAEEARAAAAERRRLEQQDAETRRQQERAAAQARKDRERSEAEARRAQQRDEAAARAIAAAEAKARAHEAAVEKARVRALQQARRSDEARCAQKKSPRLQSDCRAMVAAKYEPAPLPLPALALAPLVAPPPAAHAPAGAPPAAHASADAPPAAAPPSDSRRAVVSPPARGALSAVSRDDRPAAVAAVARDDRAPGVRLASAAEPARATTFAPVPHDEGAVASRHADVRNDLQVGPQSLVLDKLTARTEISPESLQAGLAYRFALDDAGAAHHLFGASLESSRCQEDAGCGFRWSAFAGFSPQSSQAFASGAGRAHTDQLGWSAGVAAGSVSYGGRLLSFALDGQFEALSIDYARNTEPGGNLTRTAGSLDQLRLRGTAGIASGPWSGSLRVAGYAYAGNAPESFQLVPLRGALIDDDSAGLAGGPQSFQARLEGRYDAASGLSLAASYGYLSYVGPYWSSANLLAAGVSQRFGRFRVGFGLVYEGETDRTGAGFPTLFGTGTVGASF